MTKRKKSEAVEEDNGLSTVGSGRGKYALQKNGKQKRGNAVTYENMKEEWRAIPRDSELQRMLDNVTVMISKGRPPKYVESEDPKIDMPTRIFSLLVDPRYFHTIDGAAALLGISDVTLREWGKTHERFSTALKMGKKVQETVAASRMAQGVMYPTSLIFSMKNLHNWADKIEQTHSFNILDEMDKTKSVAAYIDWEGSTPKDVIDVPGRGDDVV